MSTASPSWSTIQTKGGWLATVPREHLWVEGQDSISFLHRLLSHDIKRLTPGQGTPACLLNAQGKIRFLIWIHRLAKGLWLETHPGQSKKLKTALASYQVSEELVIAPLPNPPEGILLLGGSIEKVLQSIHPDLKAPEEPFAHSAAPEKTGIRWIVRWNIMPIPSVYIWTEREAAESVRKTISGAAQGPISLSPEQYKTLCIEAGVPVTPNEFNETTILNELKSPDDDRFLEQWVSFNKGCYIGQEIVARIHFRAHPPRLLTGFILEGTEIPEEGSSIELEGQPVGQITSACISPTLQKPIAMGFLKQGVQGEQFKILGGKETIKAKKHPLPFIR